jgi:hypothetical protein
MPEFNDFNANAGDVVSGVEKVKKSKAGLIVGGVAVLTAGAVAAVTGGGIAAYCLSGFVKNQVKLRLSSPESYYAWVYEKNADAAAKQISTAYAKGLDKFEAGQQTKFSLRYDTTQDAKDWLKDELYFHDDEMFVLDNFSSVTLGAEGNSKDSLLSGKGYIDWNDDRLVTCDFAADTSTMDYFTRVPELTDKWLGVEAGKLIEENAYSEEEQMVIDAYKKAATDPRSVVSPEEIEQLASRYIKVWNESVGDVQLEKKQTVTINDIEMDYTVVSVELTEKKMGEIAEKFVTTAKDDALLKEIVVDRLNTMTAGEYNDALDDLLEDIRDDDLSDDETLIFDTFVDAKGVIRGFRLTGSEDNQELIAVVGKKGEKVRGKCYFYDGETDPEFKIDLTADESNGKYTGSIDYIYDEDESCSLEFTDFEIVDEDYGYFNASTVLTIKDYDDTYSVPLDFTTDGQSESISGEIIIEGTNYGRLTLTLGLQTGAEPSIPSKSGAHMISSEEDADDFWREYVTQDQMESFLKELMKKLGCDDKMAAEYAKEAAEEMYFDWDSYYDDDDWDDNGWDDDDDDDDWDDDDDDDWDDDDYYGIADGPSAEAGQAYLMLYDKDMEHFFYGDGSDFLSYGAKYADIKGDGTYTVSISAATPEYMDNFTAMPNGLGILMIACEDTKGANDAKIEITSLDIDGKKYEVSKDIITETDEDSFAAMLYSESNLDFEDDDDYKNGVDLSGIGSWKTITVTFKLTGMK